MLQGMTLAPMDEDEEEAAPLDMSWPAAWRKRITYVLILPLILPMWLTLPDTRKPESAKYFAVTFVGSIIWIAGFSYLMVWWATITGNAFTIPPEVLSNISYSYSNRYRSHQYYESKELHNTK